MAKKEDVKITEFLKEYTGLERCLSLENMTVLDYENSLQADDADMLKTCRIMRNYIVHHPNGMSFLTVSDEQIKFISKLRSRIEAKSKRVNDITFKLKPVCLGVDSYLEILNRFGSTGRDWLPVVNSKKVLLGILTAKRFMATFYSLLKNNHSPDTLFFDLSESLLTKDRKAAFVNVEKVDKQLSSVELGSQFVSVRASNIYVGVSDWSKC